MLFEFIILLKKIIYILWAISSAWLSLVNEVFRAWSKSAGLINGLWTYTQKIVHNSKSLRAGVRSDLNIKVKHRKSPMAQSFSLFIILSYKHKKTKNYQN